MPSTQQLLNQIQETCINAKLTQPDLNFLFDELRLQLNKKFPVMANIRIGQKYLVTGGKAGAITVQVTKQNTKTWIMYELENSDSPGARWMMGKTWCKAERFELLNTDAVIPSFVVVK